MRQQIENSSTKNQFEPAENDCWFNFQHWLYIYIYIYNQCFT